MKNMVAILFKSIIMVFVVIVTASFKKEERRIMRKNIAKIMTVVAASAVLAMSVVCLLYTSRCV